MKRRTVLILAVALLAVLAWGQQALAQGDHHAMWDRFWGGRMSCPSGSSNYRPSGYSGGYYQPSGYQRGGYQGYSYQQGYHPNYSPPRYSSGGYRSGHSGGVSINLGDLFSPRYGSYGGYGNDGSPSVIFVETPRVESAPMMERQIVIQQQPTAPQIVQQVPQMQQMPSFPPMPPQIIVIQQPQPAQPQIIQQPVQAPMAPPSGPIFVIMGAPAPAARDANTPAAAVQDSEETFLRQLANPDSGQREKVVRKLAKFSTSFRVERVLIDVLCDDPDEDVRREAARSLGKMKSEMAVKPLRQAAQKDPDDDVKEAAQEAIQKIRGSVLAQPVARPATAPSPKKTP